ncbi:MAG: 50S ribosomal protein L11 methyltransferase [Mariniphaga sp.]
MEYTKTSWKIDPDSEINREILVANLGNIGYESFTEAGEYIEAYIVSRDFSQEALSDLFLEDFTLFKSSYTYEIIPDQNWNEVWEKNYFQPLMIADRCLIRAPFHTDYPKAEYELIIEPAMAFGTGNHETTSLMISAILNQDLIGKSVLDMGCGTGILSILASQRGAESITGIDIDRWAINSTIENAATNGIKNLQIIEGGVEAIPEKAFDIIYANIQRNILLKDMPGYINALKMGGELIMSGFYISDLESIKSRAEELGMQFLRSDQNNTWVAAQFIRVN